ncbi:MAG TPA: hypothetical protein VGB04_11040 [Allosphingosinicella sp.]|jgi:hypothetical protein
MPNWLPAIDIGFAGEAKDFLGQMANIAAESNLFGVERHLDRPGSAGLNVVNFRFRGDSSHRDLGFQLISRPEIPSRVLIEMRAERWALDPLTHHAYCEAARSLVGPLLSAYNRAHSTRYRLRIEKTNRDSVRLSPRSATLLDRFASLANKTSLHPLDWRRFYGLVSKGRQEIPEQKMRSLLIGRGFSPEAAGRLAELYSHLWAFKRFR